jgi:thiol-disulfide isomerase/thioredoxin
VNRLAAIFLCLIFLAFGAPVRAAEASSTAPFFAASLWDVENQPLALATLRGKPLLVNFWARWCGPCREEIPELESAYQKLKARGLVMVGVAIEDKPVKVREFAAAYKMTYLVLLAKDKGLDIMRDLGNTRAGLPFTAAIDREGRIVAVKLGVLHEGDLERMLDALKIQP